MRVLELGDHPVDNFVIPVVAAEMVITTCCLNLDNTVADFKE